MDAVDRNILRTLNRSTTPHAVSIYMTTHRDTQREREDRIRLKNHLRYVEHTLDDMGCPRYDTARIIQPIGALLDERPFWQCLADGLALFLGTEGMRFFRTPIRFDDFVHIADRYHITPLIPLVHREGQFHILALSKNKVRLFRANQYEAHEVTLIHAPKNMQDALRYDDPEKQYQFHTRTPPRPGGRHAVSHGHGVGIDDEKTNIERYLHRVDKGIQSVLPDDVHEPLVLACAEPIQAIYAEVNSYPGLVETHVNGNPDTLNAQTLWSRAWPLVEPLWTARQREAVERYQNAAGTKPTSNEIGTITSKAVQGEVETLFVPARERIWGTLTTDGSQAIVHEAREAGDQDLLNLAAVETLKHDGTVFCLERDLVPGDGPAAALFRC